MTDETMQRRDLLRRAAWLLGGAISAPAALAILQGCSAKQADPAAATWTPKFFKGEQANVIAAIADALIPKTDTSGALDAGVPAFIDAVMADVYPPDQQKRFAAGIDEFAAMTSSGKRFAEHDAAHRAALVQQAIDAALSGTHEPKPFILVTRELTLLGFYTSKVGITENMEYVAVPTAYHGCVPLEDMKKHVYWE
jgi:gluconate 2-dehydrogenase gamma chain